MPKLNRHVLCNYLLMFAFFLRLIDSLVWPLFAIVIIWLAFMVNLNYGLNLNQFGLQPHSPKGLVGIFAMPFLHGDGEHLMSNTLPLFLSMGFIFLYFEKEKWMILGLIALLTGVLLWIIGEAGTNHIGASGLVYGFVAFLITHAFMSKNKESLAASFVLIFLYGGLIYGLFPEWGRIIGKNISWEGHLSGAIAGVFIAYLYRKSGPQKENFFGNEEDDDDDDEYGYWNISENDGDHTTIHYHYKDI